MSVNTSETGWSNVEWAIGDDEAGAIGGDDDIFVRIKEGNETVCYVDATPVDDPELPKRSRLIAAAPKLYQALVALMIRFEQTGEAWMSDSAMAKARDAKREADGLK